MSLIALADRQLTLTTVLDSCGHETSGWPQLYETDPDFHHLPNVGAKKVVTNFHLQDGLLCHLGHLCVPSSERVKLIWESHYSWVAGHFGMEKTSGSATKTFLLVETSTGCQQVYQVLHCLCYFQTDH
jgi:hypothetical protein